MTPTRHTSTRTVREVTLDLLRDLGINTVFGNPGSTELPFLNNWPDDFSYVLGLQELVALGMADGYAQATGNAAFVNLHSAGGLGHALGALFTAFRNQTPMVVTAGQQTRSLFQMHPFLFAEQATEFPKPYVKWSCEPARPEDVPTAIARAYHAAMQKPCGPTFVSIASDDWDAPARPVPKRTVARDAAPDPRMLDKFIAAIAGSEHPAIVVGSQIDHERCWADVVEFAERIDAPVWVAPFASRACFPETHRLFQGFLPASPVAVGAALASADLVVVLGAPVFTFHIPGECSLFERDVELLQITDDPAAAARAAIGTSVVGSLTLALGYMKPRLERRTSAPRAVSRGVPPPPPASTAMTAEYLIHRLAIRRPHDCIVVEEAPSHRPAIQAHMPFSRPGSFVTMASGGLGFGLPAAVGTALADPSRRVVCVIGDGSIMYSIQALWTAVQQAAPVTVVVINNGGYGAMRSFSKVLGVTGVPGTDLPGLDFVALAAGLGCPARRVSDPGALDEALGWALASAGPALLEVVVEAGVTSLY